MISIIAAVGKNLELGKDNGLVFHIKEDMKFFKETTTGHACIMGYKTFQSIGSPLKNRDNYVATFSADSLPEGVTPVTDLHAFLKEHQDDEDELFVIGGATIYRESLPYASTLYLTEIDASVDADVFFPEFDKSKYDRTVIKEGKQDDLTYSFVKYKLKEIL